MKLTNKVTNAFFGIIAVIALFMPLAGYQTLLTAEEYNLMDIINLLKNINPQSDVTLLGNLGQYGFKEEAVLVVVFFVLALVLMAATLVLSVVNVPYLVRTAVSGLGAGSFIAAAVFFNKIGAAFAAGTIPTSAITSLSGGSNEGSILSALLSSFASIQRMGVTVGVYVAVTCLIILFAVNLVFFIFRKKIALADGEKSAEKGKKKKSKK